MLYDLPQSQIQGWLTCTGKGYIIQMRVTLQKAIELVQNLVDRKEVFPLGYQMRSALNLAIYAIQGTVFVGHKVHSEGYSQTAGHNRPEEMLVFHLKGSAKLQMRFPAAFIQVVGIVEPD